MGDIIIHIGLMKTGTTFLQEEIFKKMNITYIRDIHFTNLCRDFRGKVIIANEALSGDPYSDEINRYKIINNLYALFPYARIIVGIRDKWDMMYSLYSQYIRNGGYNSRILYYIRNYVEYDDFIEYVKGTFPGRVFVYDYDRDLKNNKHDFIKRLCNFIGKPIPDWKDRKYRVSLEPYQIKTIHKINYIFRRHPFAGKVIRELINVISNSQMQRQ